MEFTIQNFIDTTKFIKAYLNFGEESISRNKDRLRGIVPAHQFEHLFNSWRGREGDFGSFFLNLSHRNQGAFIAGFGINVPGYKEFVKAIENHPPAYLYADPPEIICWLHELMIFFNNNAISATAIKGYTLGSIPRAAYGNSKNWGKYIMSLSTAEQSRVLAQISFNARAEIKRKKEQRASFKTPNLTPREV